MIVCVIVCAFHDYSVDTYMYYVMDMFKMKGGIDLPDSYKDLLNNPLDSSSKNHFYESEFSFEQIVHILDSFTPPDFIKLFESTWRRGKISPTLISALYKNEMTTKNQFYPTICHHNVNNNQQVNEFIHTEESSNDMRNQCNL